MTAPARTDSPIDVAIPVFRLRRDGGVERYTWEVAASLAGQGHRVRVLAGRDDGTATTPQGVECISVGRAGALNTWSGGLAATTFPMRARARLLFDRRRPVLYGPLGSMLPPGVVTAFSVHAAWVRARARVLDDDRLTLFDRTQLLFEQVSYRMPRTLVTALAPRCADEVAEIYGVPRASIIVIPPGIDPAEFSPVRDEERAEARSRYGIDASVFTVGIAANYAFRNKGVASLIRAAARCDVTLAVAGISDRQVGHYEQLADDEGAHVLFLGAVADMRTFYSALDVFALPSVYEAYGMAAHEAMACGIATVVSSVSGIAGLCEGSQPLLTVEPHDVDDLVAVIESLRDDDRRRALAARGVEWAHSRTWSHVGHDVARALEQYGGRR